MVQFLSGFITSFMKIVVISAPLKYIENLNEFMASLQNKTKGIRLLKKFLQAYQHPEKLC